MRKRFGVAVGVLVATTCVWASGASAATEFGSNCVASTAAGPQSIVQTAQAPGSRVPLAVPSAGVITRWKISLIPVPFSIPEQLKVFRPTATPKQFLVVGESAVSNVLPGANSFEVRIPVQAGDLVGLYGSGGEVGTLLCESESPVDNVAAIAGSPPVGSTATVTEEANELAGAVLATVEPDADGDTYGDETQDKCPTSAAVQAVPCPALLLDAVAGAVGKSAVTILVATSTDAPVKATGTVKLPGGSKARVSAQATIKAPPKTVAAGKIGSIKLKFPKKVKSALAALPKSKSLKLKVTAQGTNVAGVVSTDKLTVKLKGQG